MLTTLQKSRDKEQKEAAKQEEKAKQDWEQEKKEFIDRNKQVGALLHILFHQMIKIFIC